MTIRKLRLLVVFAFLSGTRVLGQINVEFLTIQQYVQDVLLGSGIQATNITFAGCPSQIGYMTGGASAGLGIDSGVILSTEHAQNIQSPSPNLGLFGGNCTISGDPSLLNIANSVPPLIGQNFTVNSVNDIARLEFDFVPTGDTLRFKYIFGSDEYLEWVNSSYNDIFAFLLSGPGITGPYAAPPGFPGGAVNIARLPNTNPPLPITISSVNNVVNSTFYIDNFNNVGISIDGYTVTLEAWYPVQCGQTYHIKLAIADGSDTALESIVILQEGSFSSNAVVDVELAITVGPPGVDVLYEDCGEAIITFSRSPVSDLSVEDMVIVTWGGQAIMGQDYNVMPDTIIFPVGVASISFTLDALEDGIAEGLELVVLNILNLGACNGSGLVSNFQFFINDEPQPLSVPGYDTEVCLGASVELVPEISGGYGNYTYQWSTNQTSETITVSPQVSTTYFLTVGDTCGLPPINTQFLVDVLVFDPLAVIINEGNQLLNCGQQVFLTATASGGNGPYTYSWYNQAGTTFNGTGNGLWYNANSGAGTLFVRAIDQCGLEVVNSIQITLNVPALLVSVPAQQSVPCSSPFTVSASASGGQPGYTYSWSYNGVIAPGQTSSTYNGNTNVPGNLVVTVNDNCTQSTSAVVSITIDSPPILIALPDSVFGTCATVFNFTPTVTQGSGGFTYQWTQNGNTLGSQANQSFNTPVSTNVQLQVNDVCSAVAFHSIAVEINNPPVFVDLGPDRFASCLDNTLLVPVVSGGSGGNTFSWSVNGTTQANGPSYTIQTYTTVDVTVVTTDACGATASDVVTIHIPDIPVILETAPDTSICLFGSAQLWAQASGGEGIFTYFWPHSGATTNSIVLSELVFSGLYTVTATDQCGKSATEEISVIVRPINAGFTVDQLSETEFEFTAVPSPPCSDCTYIWDFGDGQSAMGPFVSHRYDGLSNYTIYHTAVNGIGCTDITSYNILFPPLLYVPSAFTPNGDGINDGFLVVVSGARDFELQIFNRWGDKVFESTDPTQAWMGDDRGRGSYFVPDGVYNYVVRVRGYNGDAIEKTGQVTIIR